MGRGRSSLCVSTQAGCARACTFCETGRLGLLRNLTVAEIVGQVVLQHRDERPATLVFQGMGEPLDNLDGLLGAIAVLTDPAGLAYAHDRLTVCTVGHVPGIDALAHAGNKRLNLSLSLNAADDRQRAALMPRSVRYPLVEIAAALQRYRRRKNLALGIHWCLLPGLNDTPADAERIAAFCRDLAPGEAEIDRFVALLRDRGLPVRRRMTKGRSVMAACGQLGGIGTATPGT
jgi:23S rRNA (adenine2503-C2)-methyltransferase